VRFANYKEMKRIIIKTSLIIIAHVNLCMGQGEIKKIFLSDFDVKLNGDQKCQRYIQTHAVNKETARYLYSPLELVFKDDKLMQAFEWSEGTRYKRELKEDEIGMHYIEVEQHSIYQIQRTSKSKSYLGGEPPDSLTIPRLNFIAPFQYLGMISKNDDAFNGLPFDLHLIAPIYLNFESVFIDYSDPSKPEVLNRDQLQTTSTSFPNELKMNSEIIYEKTFFSATKTNHFHLNFAHSGIPHWIQVPKIPVCPKSDNAMKFVMQISSNTGIKTKHHNITSNKDFMLKYFENLNFWGDGYMYIFIEPQTKVVCYIIQNT